MKSLHIPMISVVDCTTTEPKIDRDNLLINTESNSVVSAGNAESAISSFIRLQMLFYRKTVQDTMEVLKGQYRRKTKSMVPTSEESGKSRKTRSL